ncbi:hypothetical protein AAFF_G00199940 [Aldrovandia affinis]|uniref:Uncharacterized protein n=1 Tax=Aldrovandia affinis TaxID=143900 RepID=A0AAD7RIE1_9TELE|nr:hypothetical protein AAFF_G00199940 [Aldrovandia affinis]
MQTVGLIHTLEQCLNRMQTVGLIHTLEQCLNRMQTVGLIHTLEQCLNRMQTVGLIHTLEQCLNRMQTVRLIHTLEQCLNRMQTVGPICMVGPSASAGRANHQNFPLGWEEQTASLVARRACTRHRLMGKKRKREKAVQAKPSRGPLRVDQSDGPV